MKKKFYLFIFVLLTVLSYSPVFGDGLTGIINNPYDIGMVMYSKSSLSGDVVITVMNNTPVTVISDQVEKDGYRWIQVHTEDGHEGWVFATGVTDLEGKLLAPSFITSTQTTSNTSSFDRSNSSKSTVNSYPTKTNNNNFVKLPNTNYSDNNPSFGERMVWIYETGKRYHSHAGCSGSGDWQVTIGEAESLGRTECLKCYR